ncbi:MAG: hypothetical protein K6E85_03390 [Lachnospiraceae bacterium]|nr:hypothetical protein [Lachnospiraceae bacterium]
MKKTKLFTVFIGIMAVIGLFSGGCSQSKQPPVLRVAIPYSDKVQDVDTNYYIRWLEARTGLDLEITLIRQTRSVEYLDALFSSGAEIDVVMFGGDFTVSDEELDRFIESGDVYIETESREGNDNNATDADLYGDDAGRKVKYLNYGASARNRAGQILWINYEWLKKLHLSVPSNTVELENVLAAFRDNDPNGNGIRDEIPLAGSVPVDLSPEKTDAYAYAPYELILNSYVYNDPYHSRYAPVLKKDTLSDNSINVPDNITAFTDEFREGLAFCHRLYEKGLMDPDIFECSLNRLREMVNSLADLIGAFTSDSLSDVIYQGNPEIMARFIHVAPLAGPEGVRNALYKESRPVCGAVINAHSKKISEAKLLLDTMMTEEASLIARYGERGVDWDFSEGSDVSIYGGASTIVTFNYIWNTPQNKHLNGIGPMNVPDRYLKGVTWNGINSDTEYIDGRAQISYIDCLPDIESLHEADTELSEYLDRAVKEFITGERDIYDDEIWKAYKFE